MSTGLVRFITAGSVDDGKSTLIGRLLYDTKAVLSDQLAALSRTKHARVRAADAQVDLALLTDGLEAEREQGITIDVAYRYFVTAKKKFIVADAPGHEQYTRNLVTGASQSDVAVILVDATRVDFTTQPVTLLAQTKRHAAIVRLLGLRHVVVAVNKMDLLDFDQKAFEQIAQSIQDLAQKLGLPIPHLIPVSALLGDNVVSASTRTSWYHGPSLLQWLEDLEISGSPEFKSLRLPVQYVARQDGSAADDFRGYLGRIEAGQLQIGQRVKVLPSGLESTISELHISCGVTVANITSEPQVGRAGQSVMVSLADDIDVSRGDLIVAVQPVLKTFERLSANSVQSEVQAQAHGQMQTQELFLEATLTKHLYADVCWLDAEPLSLARKYVLQHTTNSVFAKVKGVKRVLDVHTLSHGFEASTLNTNDVGRIELTLQKPIAADLFDDLPNTGAFVLIDATTQHTVAAGMIRSLTP